MTALGKRATACKAWRWMPGMLPDSTASRGTDYRGRKAQVSVHRVTPNGIKHHPERYAAAVPVLTDPATLGCLLSLVRGAWGMPLLTPVAYLDENLTCTIPGQGFVWIIVGRRLGGTGWGLDNSEHDSEAECLVAALEAAP